jgi:predicted MPP superfamily phosphohydrolase
MHTATLIHLLLLLGCEVAVVWFVFKRRSIARAASGVLSLLAVGLGLSLLLGEDGFGVIRLATWLLGIHLPLLLAVLAVLLRGTSRLASIAGLVLAVGGGAITAWAVFVEPTRLEVTRHTVEMPGLSEPLRVVVVADIQTDHVGEYEREVLTRAIAEMPDLLLLPGDYIQEHDPARRRAQRKALNALMSELDFRGRLGTVAVEGNMEVGDWLPTFDGLGFHVASETQRYRIGPLTVTALNLHDSFDERLALPPVTGPHLVVGHAPDFALSSSHDADLMVAGHTHGGQIRIPGLGPLMTLSKVPRAWAAGLTRLPSGSTLVVSRGAGLERGYAPPIRLFCRPEIVVLDLVPSSDK